ncbi:MAG: hypothetical protein KDD46_07995 [Bdellovibrionales bacterium]|nr:hypothetical protein [Bdellovibrionales bacterium]
MNKVYKHLSSYEHFYGFEKTDGVILGAISVLFFFIFELIFAGSVLVLTYSLFCLLFKRKKPVGWLQSYLTYHIRPKVFKPGGSRSYE